MTNCDYNLKMLLRIVLFEKEEPLKFVAFSNFFIATHSVLLNSLSFSIMQNTVLDD